MSHTQIVETGLDAALNLSTEKVLAFLLVVITIIIIRNGGIDVRGGVKINLANRMKERSTKSRQR